MKVAGVLLAIVCVAPGASAPAMSELGWAREEPQQTNSAAVVDELEFVSLLRAAELNCQGASLGTKERITERFLTDHFDRTIRLSSAVITNVTDREAPTADEITFKVASSLSGCAEHRIPLSALKGFLGKYDFPIGRGHDGGEVVRAGKVSLEKSYRDRTIRYWLLLPYQQEDQLLDTLRVGQKVTVDFVFYQIADNLVVGILDSLVPETGVLRCDNGHEYAPSVGYKFCPIDGLPLKKGGAGG